MLEEFFSLLKQVFCKYNLFLSKKFREVQLFFSF
nr:MAG TPA: hypothetical protein [Caudoviricetes sp.]